MFCLRRAAVRALSFPYRPISARPRSITTLTSSIARRNTPVYVSPFQRRFASEGPTQAELETQTEPEADGATEVQHGQTSIASSANDLSEPANEESSATERAIESAAQEDQAFSHEEQPASTLASDTAESADQEEHGAVVSAISSAAESFKASVTSSAQAAREHVADAASAVGGSAGVANAIAGRDNSGSQKLQPAHTLYVGNLFFDVTEDALKREMERFGAVKSIKIIHDGRGLSKGFGYVEYADPAAATKAIESLNQQVFEGRRLTVQYTLRKERSVPSGMTSRNTPSKTLFIGNMSFEMTDKDLNDLFREIKNVIDVRVAIDRRTGQPRGFAHADFVDVASASKAFEILQSKEIYGRKLRVDYSLSSTQTRNNPSTM